MKIKTKNKLDIVKDEPISDKIIDEYLKNPKIIEYKELKNYKNINQLLPKNKDYVIILFRHPTGAHWQGLLKNNNIIEFFCSYGTFPDECYYNWETQKENDSFEQFQPYLSNLLNNCNYECVYNPIQYQSMKNDISTCGRFVLMRIFFLINHGGNLNDFYNYLKRKKKEYKLSYDELVSIVINKLNDE